MRISKEVARQIAKKLTEKSKDAWHVLLTEFKDLVRSEYEKETPKEILEAFKKHPEWIQTSSQVVLSGCGFRYEHVSVKPYVIKNNNSGANLEMNPKIGDKLKKAQNKAKEAEVKYENLLSETEQALITLGTHARIRETMPEAAQYLPPPISNSLVVNFDSLNKRLKSQPTVKKESEVTA